MTRTTPPVIFMIFNRPDFTKQVFEMIRAAKPSKLLLVADGPRSDRPGEAEKCAAARKVVEGVDWDCEIETNYSETNMGCRLRCSSGVTWAFELVDRAIILEDDCLPSASFFPYCANLIDRYASDDRVMMINGQNRLFGRPGTDDSYYFSRYPHPWGWATWRRAWAKYDSDMTHWPEIRDRRLFDQYFPTRLERYYWDSTLQYAYDGRIDTWDYKWFYTIWANSGLCVTPARNLVRNIGFNAEATHTTSSGVYSSLYAEELSMPFRHPASLMASSDSDAVEATLRISRRRGLHGFLYALNRDVAALKMVVKRATGRGKWPHPGLLVRGWGGPHPE